MSNKEQRNIKKILNKNRTRSKTTNPIIFIIFYLQFTIITVLLANSAFVIEVGEQVIVSTVVTECCLIAELASASTLEASFIAKISELLVKLGATDVARSQRIVVKELKLVGTTIIVAVANVIHRFVVHLEAHRRTHLKIVELDTEKPTGHNKVVVDND